jgi:hypothetical protein
MILRTQRQVLIDGTVMATFNKLQPHYKQALIHDLEEPTMRDFAIAACLRQTLAHTNDLVDRDGNPTVKLSSLSDETLSKLKSAALSLALEHMPLVFKDVATNRPLDIKLVAVGQRFKDAMYLSAKSAGTYVEVTFPEPKESK